MAGRRRRSTISTRPLRVDPDPGWMDYRHYQAGLAYFGQGRFEEAVGVLEKIDMQSPDPWAKFYARAGACFGLRASRPQRPDRDLHGPVEEAVMAERNDEEPNQLLTQKFFVFKNEADIERLLDGLSKAGVPELPADVDLDPKDRLTGPEIKSLVFGHELRGRKTAPEVEPL